MIAAGTILHDTYRIDAELGRGGMGRVYAATHTRLPRRFAVKIVKETTDAQALKRFRREAEICSQIGHRNIVQVFDFNEHDGQPYIVMELLTGESLRQRLDREPVLPRPLVVQMVREIGKALAAAHAVGVVHRDLKPANLFLAAEEGVERFKVLDFGISKIMGAGTLQTSEDALLGTPGYMPPEQARGEVQNVTGAADQFSLGAIVYEALAGHPAFVSPGDTPYTVLYKILSKQPAPLFGEPPAVRAILARALAKDPAARFADVTEMTTELASALEAPAPVAGKPPRRRAAWIALALAASAAVGGGVVAARVLRARPAKTAHVASHVASAPTPAVERGAVAPPPTVAPPTPRTQMPAVAAAPMPVVEPATKTPPKPQHHTPKPPAKTSPAKTSPANDGDEELSNPYGATP